VASILFAPPAWAEYVFREGNGGQQDVVCTLPQAILTVNFQSDPYSCENDEARSVVLNNIPAGAMLVVYDDPGCGTGDDYTRIRVLENISQVTIGTFEGGSYPPSISYQHFHDNGLDGKVSCAEISLCGDNVCSGGENATLCSADCSGGGGARPGRAR
jgi:hypothetical protein